jgi:DNA-binding PadR family transcriptional regulator
MVNRRGPSTEPYRRRLLGLYALSVMEQEGGLHGYRLSERVAERTEGAWRPAAGAVYPALRRLVQDRNARVRTEGRRRIYELTPTGKALLRRIRTQAPFGTRGGTDDGMLWSEVMGIRDPGEFLLRRLERDLDRIVRYLARSNVGSGELEALRARVTREIDAFHSRIAPRAEAHVVSFPLGRRSRG